MMYIINQGIAYAGAGSIGTLAHFVVMFSLLHTGFVHVAAASTTGAVTGTLINYVLMRQYVFRSRARHSVALPKFASIALCGIVLNALVIGICAPVLGALAGQIVASGAVLICGFVMNRSWSFHE